MESILLLSNINFIELKTKVTTGFRARVLS